MIRFAFRLGRLERLRASEKREARAVLALALGEAYDSQARRELLERTYQEAEASALPPALESEPRAWRDLAEWRDGLRAAAAAAASDELAAIGRAQEAETAYTRAARSHRVLEKLHERKWQRWLDEGRRDEQKFLDEMHVLRVARGRAREEDRG